jgi:hypothetical protein
MLMSTSSDIHAQSALYRYLRDEVARVTEHEEPYEPTSGRDDPPEHQLHLLWQRQELFRQPLMTSDRQQVTVYRTGRWTRGSGPDFRDAKLRLHDGPIRVGAVEVHVLASDWFRHGHDQDPAYTKVLLHVVWHNDLGARRVVDASGRQIPQLVLSTSLTTTAAEWQGVLDDERLPTGSTPSITPCQRSLQEMTPETVGHLLDMAGEERWRQKANRFALRAERRGIEQALYESLLEALGFQGNRMLFWQLARLAPVERMRGVLAGGQPTAIRVQAVLYGVSGFLRHWQAVRRTDRQDVDAYLAVLTGHWEPVAALFPEQLDERQWRTAGIRPANFPQRRIAAAGHLLAGLSQHSLMDRFLEPLRTLEARASSRQLRRCLRDLARRLRVPGEADFWGRRYALTGPEQGRSIDLLGPGRSTTMVVDILLPAAAALAQLGREPIPLAVVRELYRCHPRLPTNEVTRDMERQFFGVGHAHPTVVDSACRQQGLMQLYRDFCLNESETCQECALPRLVARLEQLRRDIPPAVS